MSKRYMTKPEHNAILAGLRCLQDRLMGAPQSRAEIDDILTSGLDEVDADCASEVIDIDGIDELCEAINFDEVQLTVEGD